MKANRETTLLIGSRFIQMDREITEMRKLTKSMKVGMDYYQFLFGLVFYFIGI